MAETMSVTRGLAELKLIEKKINKIIEKELFVSFRKGDDSPKGFKSIEEFESSVKSVNDKINDLKERYRIIKSEIILSNASINVKISNNEMTVAEAIEYKNSIKFDKNQLYIYNKQLINCHDEVESKNEEVNYRLDNLVITNLGKDTKINSDDYKSISEPFLKKNKWQVIDPINIKSICEKLQKKIEDFELEVDFVLSESNAKTKIQIN